MGACSCSEKPALTKEELDSLKSSLFSTNEEVIVPWSRTTYIGGIHGGKPREGHFCLTNSNVYFVASSWKFKQPIKKITEVVYSDRYKERRAEDFTIFKLDEEGKDFAVVFRENVEKLKADCKSVIVEKKGSIVIIGDRL